MRVSARHFFFLFSDRLPVDHKTITEDLQVALANVKAARIQYEAAAVESRYQILRLLHGLVAARDAVQVYDQFLDRFAGKTADEQEANMNLFLKLAMIQGITADSTVRRGWNWNDFRFEDLNAEVPIYKTAWDFYEALSRADAQRPPLGFYLVPRHEEFGLEPHWVPIEVGLDLFPLLLLISLASFAEISSGAGEGLHPP